MNNTIDSGVLDKIKAQKKIIKADINVKELDLILLQKGESYWSGLQKARTERRRVVNYLLGDQWGDTMTDPDDPTKTITEETNIINNGGVPLKQNMMRSLDKSLKGQYHQNPTRSTIVARVREKQEVSEMLNCAMEYVKQINNGNDKDIKAFGEFALSGLPIQKILWDHFPNRDRKDIRITNMGMERMFFNTDIEESNGEDLTLIGQIIDISLDKLTSVFANSKEDQEALKDIYAYTDDENFVYAQELSKAGRENLDFYIPFEQHKCRIYEIWYKKGVWRLDCHDWATGEWTVQDKDEKEIDAENEVRLRTGLEAGIPEEEIGLIEYHPIFEQVWFVKYLTPLGQVIKEMETPYAHQEHPFAFYAYPLIDGETSGFLQDSIDQQRQINRLLILWDMAMSASVKGLMMVPESAVPKNMSNEEWAMEAKKFGGIMFYKYDPQSPNAIPQHVKANSVPAGMGDLLNIHLKLINDISGVSEASRGQAPSAGTSASRYMQEAQNSSVNTLDTMMAFSSFIKVRDTKILKLIEQFYKEPRFLAVAGKSYADDIKEFDPEKIKDLETELVVQQANDTPVFRMLMEEQLTKLLDGKYIDVLQYLEHSGMPGADKLSDTIKAGQQQQMEAMQQLPPEQLQQMGGGDPRAMQMLQQSMNQN